MARTPHVRIAPGLPLRTFVFSPLRGVAGYVEPVFPHPGLVRRLDWTRNYTPGTALWGCLLESSIRRRALGAQKKHDLNGCSKYVD